MEDNTGTVRRESVLTIRTNSARPPNPTASANNPQPKRSARLTKTVASGLCALIEGQRCFADEFGLSLARVFPKSYTLVEGRAVEDVVRDILRAGDEGCDKLALLLEDLCLHQVAVVGAIEDIALTTLGELSPATIREDVSDRWVTDAKMWKVYKEKIRMFEDNENIRYERLIAAGFVPAYAKAREGD